MTIGFSRAAPAPAGVVRRPRQPGRPRSEQAEQAIIKAVLDLLAEFGVPGISIEGVAQRAGVAKTTVYRRWSDKCALILAALEHLKGPIPTPPGIGVREDLVHLLRGNRDNVDRDLADRIFPKLYAEINGNPEFAAAYRERVIAPRRRVVMSVLCQGVAEGLIRADTDLELAVELLGASVVMCQISRGRRHTDKEIAQIVDTVLNGLCVPK